jgi:hypothetical protein
VSVHGGRAMIAGLGRGRLTPFAVNFFYRTRSDGR